MSVFLYALRGDTRPGYISRGGGGGGRGGGRPNRDHIRLVFRNSHMSCQWKPVCFRGYAEDSSFLGLAPQSDVAGPIAFGDVAGWAHLAFQERETRPGTALSRVREGQGPGRDGGISGREQPSTARQARRDAAPCDLVLSSNKTCACRL